MNFLKKHWLILLISGSAVVIFFSFHGLYLSVQGYYLIRDQLRARPMSSMLEDPSSSEKTRRLIRSIEKVRSFGIRQLNLKAGSHYQNYIATEKPYLVDVVSACEKVSFTEKTWNFPFFGSFPYLGFYLRKDAESLANHLKSEGWDVLIRKVTAFSTLGFFSDPVYSFMEEDSEADLASLVFHEMSHATVFIDNQTQFNENLAVFIENQGCLFFLKTFYGQNSSTYQEELSRQKERKVFIGMLKKTAEKLGNLYKSDKSEAEKLLEREKIFSDFKKEFEADYDKNFSDQRYRYVLKLSMNNAFFRLFLLYEEKQEPFQRFYADCKNDLRRMIQILKTLSPHETDPWAWLEKKCDEIRTQKKEER